MLVVYFKDFNLDFYKRTISVVPILVKIPVSLDKSEPKIYVSNLAESS